MRYPFAFTAAMALMLAAPAFPQRETCADSSSLRLFNGRIHTMDRQDSVVGEVTIQQGRFAYLGPVRGARLDPCTKSIDLHGRTAVPGLVDNHNHIVLLGLRPGFDTRLETAASIADAQALIRARAKDVPPGEFITAMGGWNPAQFAEKRLPTSAELDAAAPDHPVIVYQSFTGPAAVNTRAKAFFASKGIAVNDTGIIAANAPSVAALDALRAAQTFADQKRGTLDAMAYAASVGVTTSADMGAFVIPGLPDIQDSFTMDTLASADPFHMYDAFNELHREGKMSMRLRIFFLSMDKQPDIPMLKERLLNSLLYFGDDMLRVSGIGEFATQWPLFGNAAPPPNYTAALELIAKEGWPFQQHSLSPAEDQLAVNAFEKVNAITPIRDLRWSIAHAPRIDQATVNRLKAMGAGIAVHPFLYLAAQGGGPPLRMILDSGIHVGAGSDSAQISTLDPWLMIYYMVTGKNASGALVNDKQQITRAEALRLYTANNGWFLHEEDKLGSIEPGKFGDVVVLNEDYFDARKVPDEEIRRLKSVLTVVGGKVVHNEMR
ncbi:MAG TPA: amidohydrolase family protein [Bryobacteraceae bacterium]|nr:amidohydrolase family protein [Bryobacteraceae bacterium]